MRPRRSRISFRRKHEISPAIGSLGSGVGAGHVHGRRPGAGLSDQAGEVGRALYACRNHRHSGAHRGAVSVRASRPAVHHRQPAGRRQQHRHRSGRQCAARRLHAAARQSGERHQCDALQEAAVQFPARYRAGRRHHPRAERDGGLSAISGEDRSGVHRLRQSASRHDQHGLVRQWHVGAFVRRAVHGHDRGQDDPRALSRRRPGADRSHRGHGRRDLRQPAVLDRVHQIGQAAGARGDDREAQSSVARCADRGRDRDRLRGKRVVRHRRAERNAGRDRRQAQPEQ